MLSQHRATSRSDRESAWRTANTGLSPGHKRFRRASPLSDLVTCEAVTRRSNGERQLSGNAESDVTNRTVGNSPYCPFRSFKSEMHWGLPQPGLNEWSRWRTSYFQRV